VKVDLVMAVDAITAGIDQLIVARAADIATRIEFICAIALWEHIAA
jgi:hypothetical protein